MKRQTRIASIAALAIGSLSVPVALAAGSADTSPTRYYPATGLIKTVQDATRPYLRLSQAEAAGYVLAGGCTSGEEGAMGVHYANFGLLGDGALDASQPEILVYEPTRDGRMQLVAAEYLVFVDAWGAGNPPPVLRGQQFHYLGSPNRYGLPAAYILHVWAWKANPNGTYANFNPRVSCDFHDAP